jgi:hypothetical protein
MQLESWSLVLSNSFRQIWMEIATIIPNILAAVIIFILGWLVGSVLGGVVSQVVKSLKVDKALESLGTGELVEKAGYRLNSGAFLGGLVKWFFVLTFLVASIDILGLTEVNVFLRQVVLGYLPNVFVAALMLLLAAVVADVAQKVVAGSAKAAGIHQAHFVGAIAKWAIWIFAIMVALSQLGIAEAFIQTLFTGIVAMLAIAGGLAFGLGGKDSAASFLDKVRQEIANHKR